MHKYSSEQKEFIAKNVKGINSYELTDIFNKHFNLNLKPSQIRGYINNHKLKNHVNTRFKKGNIPFNKGKKGLSNGGKETQFKKGNKPANWVPIGTERVNGDGYIDVKVQDGKLYKNWKSKHIILWEKHHGQSIPKGHVVIFGDGNKGNLNIDNLILVSRAQLAILNKYGLIQNDVNLTKTGLIIADLHSKIAEVKNKRGVKR